MAPNTKDKIVIKKEGDLFAIHFQEQNKMSHIWMH